MVKHLFQVICEAQTQHFEELNFDVGLDYIYNKTSFNDA